MNGSQQTPVDITRASAAGQTPQKIAEIVKSELIDAKRSPQPREFGICGLTRVI